MVISISVTLTSAFIQESNSVPFMVLFYNYQPKKNFHDKVHEKKEYIYMFVCLGL